jgi:hypothetical protein
MTLNDVKRLQTAEYRNVWCGDSCIFIWWPIEQPGPFHPEYSDLLARRGCHPFGTFPDGDIVCWEERGLLVILHDNFEDIESRMSLEEFFERLAKLDPNLAEEVFARATPADR